MRAEDAPEPTRERTEPVGPDAADPVTSSAGLTATRAPDELVGEFDEERPGRRLSPRLEQALTAVCFAVSIFVLWQVFAPLQRGNQYYLILFLAAVLPLVFLCYRAAGRRTPPPPGPANTPDATTREATTRESPTGRWPRWPCWSACTRCCRSSWATRAAGSTPSWTGRAR